MRAVKSTVKLLEKEVAYAKQEIERYSSILLCMKDEIQTLRNTINDQKREIGQLREKHNFVLKGAAEIIQASIFEEWEIKR